MNVALFVVVLFVQQVGAPGGETKTGALERNPFRPVGGQIQTSAVEKTSGSSIESATASIDAALPVAPFIPPILDRLSSIAISKNGMKLAMFGRDLVAVGDEIEGFQVVDITIDEVVLKQDGFTVTKNLEELALRRNQSRADSGGYNEGNPFSFLAPNGNDSSRFSDVANMVQKVQSLNEMMKPFIGEQINLDGLSELLK